MDFNLDFDLVTSDERRDFIASKDLSKLTQKEIGKQFDVSEDVIGAIKNKRNWKYLTNNINFN